MRIALITAIAFAAGCSSSMQSAGIGSVQLGVEPDVVMVGDSITLTLRNASDERIGYNLCTAALERRSGGSWQAVATDRVCTMELRTLAPSDETRYRLDLPGGLAAGEYRYFTNVEAMQSGTRSVVRSESFEVSAR